MSFGEKIPQHGLDLEKLYFLDNFILLVSKIPIKDHYCLRNMCHLVIHQKKENPVTVGLKSVISIHFRLRSDFNFVFAAALHLLSILRKKEHST